MEENEPQRLAVAGILNPRHPEMPFLVFGPPGTGKTSVVVEAVKQLSACAGTKILVCAPSNSAADLLAFRLKNITGKIWRLCAPSRSPNLIMKDVLPLTTISDDTFCVPPLEQVKGYNVIVCTCISASVLYGIGVPKGHFTHVFVDEAGQAMEPEVVIPIKTLQTVATRLILAGDPQQLGPIIRSPIAQQFGLDESLLARLMALPAYKLPEHSGATIAKLLQNYRSHPSILAFSNQTFYNNELRACADTVVTNSLLRWDELPNRAFPALFHNVPGEDMREASSPSFFNPLEVAEVKRYVESLLVNNRKFSLTQDDIGIITPYNAQASKIRTALKAEWPLIKVGSVEEFQGQERRVIIISTVRSNEEHLVFDVKFSLGFVANPRRFNVAVTRAQAALVVIGDATVLKQDTLWLRFMNYLHKNNCWKGQAPDWNPRVTVPDSGLAPASSSPLDQLIALTTSMELGEAEEAAMRAEALTDRDWRVLD